MGRVRPGARFCPNGRRWCLRPRGEYSGTGNRWHHDHRDRGGWSGAADGSLSVPSVGWGSDWAGRWNVRPNGPLDYQRPAARDHDHVHDQWARLGRGERKAELVDRTNDHRCGHLGRCQLGRYADGEIGVYPVARPGFDAHSGHGGRLARFACYWTWCVRRALRFPPGNRGRVDGIRRANATGAWTRRPRGDTARRPWRRRRTAGHPGSRGCPRRRGELLLRLSCCGVDGWAVELSYGGAARFPSGASTAVAIRRVCGDGCRRPTNVVLPAGLRAVGERLRSDLVWAPPVDEWSNRRPARSYRNRQRRARGEVFAVREHRSERISARISRRLRCDLERRRPRWDGSPGPRRLRGAGFLPSHAHVCFDTDRRPDPAQWHQRIDSGRRRNRVAGCVEELCRLSRLGWTRYARRNPEIDAAGPNSSRRGQSATSRCSFRSAGCLRDCGLDSRRHICADRRSARGLRRLQAEPR